MDFSYISFKPSIYVYAQAIWIVRICSKLASTSVRPYDETRCYKIDLSILARDGATHVEVVSESEPRFSGWSPWSLWWVWVIILMSGDDHLNDMWGIIRMISFGCSPPIIQMITPDHLDDHPRSSGWSPPIILMVSALFVKQNFIWLSAPHAKQNKTCQFV